MQNIYRSGLLVFTLIILTAIGSISFSTANAEIVAAGDECGCEKIKRYDSDGSVRCNVIVRYEWKDGCCTRIERYYDSKEEKIVEDKTCYPDITEEECSTLTQCGKHSSKTKQKSGK
jgi:hypothetical protein